jgi:mRNA interferase RelE/StbE
VNSHQVQIARRALKSLALLPRHEQQRARAVIDLLAGEPRPPRCVALVGEANVYRVRVGDYRVVYEVHDDRLLVQVIRVGHRRDVCRK